MKLHHYFYAFALLLLMLGVSVHNNPGFFERSLSPNTGTCGKCDRPWNYVHAHHTMLLGGSILGDDDGIIYATGVFPLCETCWQELGTYTERIPYYLALVSSWGVESNTFNYEQWGIIQQSLYFEEFGELQDLPPVNIRE